MLNEKAPIGGNKIRIMKTKLPILKGEYTTHNSTIPSQTLGESNSVLPENNRIAIMEKKPQTYANFLVIVAKSLIHFQQNNVRKSFGKRLPMFQGTSWS